MFSKIWDEIYCYLNIVIFIIYELSFYWYKNVDNICEYIYISLIFLEVVMVIRGWYFIILSI